MFSTTNSSGNLSKQELPFIDQENGTRFQVAKVDDVDKDLDAIPMNLSSTPNQLSVGVSNHSSYVYDSRNSKSVGLTTREVPPLAEHYNSTGIHNGFRPTLDELHEGKLREKVQVKIEEVKHKRGKIIRFGWLEGVFMRCLLNIWGVMLFLRLSWVIGQAGIVEGLAVIFLSNIVTIVTTISMSAVSTNGQIKGGGIYYMISRSLGPEFGGAIGLMFTLANSIAVSMYIVGFCESLQDLLKTYDITLIDGDINDIRVVGNITLVAILILAIIGMDWVTRTQMMLLFVLCFSQIDFMIGSFIGPLDDEEISKGFIGYSWNNFRENMGPDYRFFEGVDHDFFSVFAVFFPAVTGIVAGANLSGDLKDPSSAIPIGTLLAIFVTFVSYVFYGIMMGGCMLRDASGNVTEYQLGLAENSDMPWLIFSNCTGRECSFGIENDSQAMELVSWWGPLIYGGCFAATLSSAIASLVGAPRVLQALAKDKLYPFIGFFGEGFGANNDPVRGYVLVFIISFGCILIAKLNAIAPLLSNFFLAAYALINFSVFHASISKSPGWRPAFKYYNAWVSLIGTLLCILVMFLISWWTALVTFVVVVTLYLYVSYRKPDVNWGSSTQAHSYSSALKSMQELNQVEEHVKNYRPQILVLSGMPKHRPPLVDLGNLITKNHSLLICGHVLKGHHSQLVHRALIRRAKEWLLSSRVKAFFSLVDSDSFETGSQMLMQISGLGKLRPNMLLMGYKSNWQSCDQEELKQYFNVIHNAFDRHLAVGILRIRGGLDFSTYLEEDLSVEMSVLDKKDEEDKLKRNQSGIQLVTVATKNGEFECLPVTPQLIANDSNPEPKASDNLLMNGKAKGKNKSKGVTIKSKNVVEYVGKGGNQLPKHVADQISVFRSKQPKGFIDVWWLYDDGGLTLLIPHILSLRSSFSGCKLRVFSQASNKNELDREQRNLAALLSKFRIDYSDVIVIPNISEKACSETKKEFDTIISNFRPGREESNPTHKIPEEYHVSDEEIYTLKERTNRHMRLRELLLQHSKDSIFVVMALPIPRKGRESAPLYMAWLELLTKDMKPPFLIIRGNQTSVLTYYS